MNDCGNCSYGNRPLYMEPCASCKNYSNWDTETIEKDNLIKELYDYADWAQSCIYEIPIMLPDVLRKAAKALTPTRYKISEILPPSGVDVVFYFENNKVFGWYNNDTYHVYIGDNTSICCEDEPIYWSKMEGG